MTNPRVIESISEMQELSRSLKREGKKIAFVPTMGYLHQGHLSLVEGARQLGDVVVVSIFVNPTQFGPSEDFNRYPRDLEGDLKRLEPYRVEYVFYPSAREMYPKGYQTYVEVEELSKGLCGDFRPGHFRGVCTVVCKLFNIVQPDFAIFGEKDYQQLRVIERMTRDLNFPIQIIGMPTVREEDGLAMSSRNAYLSEGERKQALSLSQALFTCQELVRKGEKDSAMLKEKAQEIISQNSDARIEYIEVRDAYSLEPLEKIDRPAQMLLAVWVGNTRLIDNIRLNPDYQGG